VLGTHWTGGLDENDAISKAWGSITKNIEPSTEESYRTL